MIGIIIFSGFIMYDTKKIWLNGKNIVGCVVFNTNSVQKIDPQIGKQVSSRKIIMKMKKLMMKKINK